MKLQKKYEYLGKFLFVVMCFSSVLALLDLLSILFLDIGFFIDFTVILSTVCFGPLIGYASFVGSIPSRVARFYPEELLQYLRTDIEKLG
jgi:hypothetical protein